MIKISIITIVTFISICYQVWAKPDLAPHWYQFDRQNAFYDIGVANDYVLRTDRFCGVSAYINNKTIGSGYSSYYQCTEFVSRYLSTVYGLEYKEKFSADAGDSQGFVGKNFSPNYSSILAPKPLFRGANWETIELEKVDTPIPGDVFIDKRGHSAIIKEVDVINKTITLIEQNYVTSIKGEEYFVLNRQLSYPKKRCYFYRFPVEHIKGPISTPRVLKIKELLVEYQHKLEQFQKDFKNRNLPSKLLKMIHYLKRVKALKSQIQALEEELNQQR